MSAFASSPFLAFHVDERRQFVRSQMQEKLPCRRLDHSLEARRRPELILQTFDISEGGVGATCDVPLRPGELVMLKLPARTLNLNPSLVPSIVQRCEPAGRGYRLGLMFSTRRAA